MRTSFLAAAAALIRAVRQAVGPAYGLMLDANSFGTAAAIWAQTGASCPAGSGWAPWRCGP